MRSPKASAAASQVSRLAIILFISGIAAACSNTGRFAENPFANPFASKGAVDRSPVGSLKGAKATPLIQAQPLPPAVTGSAQAMSTIGNGSSKGWSAAGGTPITLAQGESIMTLSNRYGVPPQAILSANGLTSASQVKPGQQLIMPVYASGAAAGAATPGPLTPPVAATPIPPLRQAVAEKIDSPVPPKPVVPVRAKQIEAAKSAPKAAKPASEDDGETLTKSTPKTIAKATPKANPKRTEPKKAEAKKPAFIRAEAPKTSDAKPQHIAKAEPKRMQPAPAKPAPDDDEEAAAPAKPAKTAVRPEPKRQDVARAEPKAVLAREPDPAKAADPEPTGSIKQDEPSGESFRWPARGRVINGFSKGANEGINIALPEGTAVKSAGDGTVAYAGSELKGYGNLVLVRHANGYVSAYAHNGDLNVKRGDIVKRGQVIAKSGQSGNVSSPQLHFELRKGSTPVDPTPLLAN